VALAAAQGGGVSLHQWANFRRMGGAQRYPSMPVFVGDGFRFALPILRLNTTSRSRGASRPRFSFRMPSSKSEGAGKTGCLLHPRSRVRFAQTKLHTSIQGSWSIPAFPAQWLYGLLRALPGERLFCLRRRRDTSRQLSASTAAPEPHDFTVRSSCTRQSQPSRPPHLTARRDDGQRPSIG
jgi:hypothetical protein